MLHVLNSILGILIDNCNSLETITSPSLQGGADRVICSSNMLLSLLKTLDHLLTDFSEDI